jgi:hypothetical protein
VFNAGITRRFAATKGDSGAVIGTPVVMTGRQFPAAGPGTYFPEFHIGAES